jgi:hypothetical protein
LHPTATKTSPKIPGIGRSSGGRGGLKPCFAVGASSPLVRCQQSLFIFNPVPQQGPRPFAGEASGILCSPLARSRLSIQSKRHSLPAADVSAQRPIALLSLGHSTDAHAPGECACSTSVLTNRKSHLGLASPKHSILLRFWEEGGKCECTVSRPIPTESCTGTCEPGSRGALAGTFRFRSCASQPSFASESACLF